MKHHFGLFCMATAGAIGSAAWEERSIGWAILAGALAFVAGVVLAPELNR